MIVKTKNLFLPMKSNLKISKKAFSLAIYFLSVLFFATVFLCIFFITAHRNSLFRKNASQENRIAHVLVIGSYKNEVITRQIYNGAKKMAEKYNSVVELYIPTFQSSDTSLQALFDYAGYINADGIIAFVGSSDKKLVTPRDVDDYKIPLITTGTYVPELSQISYIGNSYWEVGKKIAEDAEELLMNSRGDICIINNNSSPNPNDSTLLNSMQSYFRTFKGINCKVVPKVSLNDTSDVFICLSEEITIQTVQFFQEFYPTKKLHIIGFGSNNTCEIYLEKGLITELVTINPEKIGEEAMTALFEYKSKGYTSNYITADVKVWRAK